MADDEGPAAGAGRPRRRERRPSARVSRAVHGAQLRAGCDGGRRVERELRYEYDAAMEASYGSQLLRAFRRATQEPAALHPFIIGARPRRTCAPR